MSRRDDMLSKTIHVKARHPELLRKAVSPEEAHQDAARFRWSSSEANDGVKFELEAEDRVAMKAAESSVSRLSQVFDKMSELFRR